MSRPADPNAREALVRAARAEFLKQGIRAARVEDVTAACGLSKGAFYLHFESKEALFRQLMESFEQALAQCSDEKMRAVQAFFAEQGPLVMADFDNKTDRYEKVVALETEHDTRILETMWEHRDVMSVLIGGCAGTEFDGLVWKMVDREAARVAANFRELQTAGVCRGDIRPEFFGSLIVGTYLLVGKQLIHETSKPNLTEWALSLQRLIREGCSFKNDPSAIDSNARRPGPGRPRKRPRVYAVLSRSKKRRTPSLARGKK